jgi:hypothetical protein
LPGGQGFAGALIGGPPAATQKAEGYQGTPFTGVLDGNDHEIRHLRIEISWAGIPGPNVDYVGLIAQVGEKGQVKRLGLANTIIIGGDAFVGALAGENRGIILACDCSADVTGYSTVGGLVGRNDGGTIVSSDSAGRVEGFYVGGLVGEHRKGTISASHSTASVRQRKHLLDMVDYAGGLVGQNWNGTISSSYSSGDVVGDTDSGGLVGVSFGTIYSCYSSSNVTGGSAGGLVGRNGGGILSSYATGGVSGTYLAGGLVGEDNAGGIIASYSTARVTGNKHVGGLIGDTLGPYTSVYFSYWVVEASGLKESAGGEGKTAQQMMSRETFTGWGRGAQWVLEDGKDYPHLTWEGRSGVPIIDPPHYSSGTGDPNNPYQIRTAEDLAAVGRFPADWEAGFELVDDIDMISIDPNKLLAIGTNGLPFGGTFDGRGHTVRNFNGSFLQGACTGLFGWIGPSGTVRYLHLKDVAIVRGNVVGGLAGSNEGTILACSTTGHVTASWKAGGIVGDNGGTVASSCARCDVLEGTPQWVGGLVAVNYGTVSSCYATGSVQGEWVGGLVGYNGDGTIITSYATGVVKLQGSVGNAGGLVSRISFDDGRANRGRPARPPDKGYGIVTASFWDTQTSGFSGTSGGSGLSTSEMQKPGTFLNAGWDFIGETANGTEDIWWIDEGKDYPRLWWELQN